MCLHSILRATSIITILAATLPIALHSQELSNLSPLLASSSGKQASVASLGEGKVTVVTFWLSNCSPSKRQLEAMQPLVEEFGDRAVFIGVAIDNAKTISRAQSLARKYTMNMLFDPEQELFSIVNGLEHPYTLVFDSHGQLTLRHAGFLEGDEKGLRTHIEQLLPSTETTTR